MEHKAANRLEILRMARQTAARIVEHHSEVRRILLIGSFARPEYDAGSDMEILIVLSASTKPFGRRVEEFFNDCPAYPTKVFPITEDELRARLEEEDAFWLSALKEGIQCYPVAGCFE